MNLDEFLNSQEEIYDSFRDISNVVQYGLSPDENALGTGGYIIALRHSRAISDKISDFANLVSKVVPSIAYSSEDIHTTISDFSVGMNFSPDNKVLDKLCSIVKASLANHDVSAPEINYGKWLYKPDAVIVPGIPDEKFIELSNAVVEEGKEAGYNLRNPWGAHITALRITEKKPANELAQFYSLVEFAPIIGKSRAESVDVGYFSLDKNRFSFTPCEKFRI
ncbi:MAG: hypothetical protein NTV63_03215 [Candidatus Woesearchaeota archaeon]|nr:hypothetical protein [Candidatus Woesearchaeota archaeon]